MREMSKENKTIRSLLNDMNGIRGLRKNHPSQRESEQWNSIEKSNFCRRLLWEEFCPSLYVVETKNNDTGITTRWLIDGKQRFTTIEDFANNKFKIHNKTRMAIIPYVEYVYEDVNGIKQRAIDEDGNYKYQIAEFDIRGKKFSDLPLDLQSKFLDCELTLDIRKNGTVDDIRNDILDYNSGKPMNASQIGVNNLGVDYSIKIRNLARHPFIMDCCGFTATDKKKSNELRAIAEGIMLSNYPEDWKKDFQDIGDFLNANLTDNIILETKANYDRLYKVIPQNNEHIEKFLTLKDFPIIMAAYDYFLSKDLDDDYFGLFIEEWCTNVAPVVSEELIDKHGNQCDYSTYFRDGGKSKTKVIERVQYIDDCMDKFFKENNIE